MRLLKDIWKATLWSFNALGPLVIMYLAVSKGSVPGAIVGAAFYIVEAGRFDRSRKT